MAVLVARPKRVLTGKPLEFQPMASRSFCPTVTGAIAAGRAAALCLAVTTSALLALLMTAPASAQALRSPSSNSVAAGSTAERNSTPTPSTTGLPSVTARQSTSTGTGSPSRLSILGMPLRIAAPVSPPYDSTGGTSTFAGQPARGGDVVLQQSIDGAP
jgi:hypothetical protein